MGEESIYRSIIRMAKEQPGLPYRFQDIFRAGQSEGLTLLRGETLAPGLRGQLAKDLAQLVVDCLPEAVASDRLMDFLGDNSLILYLDAFSRRITLMLQEQLVDRHSLYRLAVHLVTDSRAADAVKLGLLLLGCFPSDLATQMIKPLGLHSEFTVFALVASQRWVNANQLAFYFAQHTSGFGKLAAVNALEPLTLEQQQWVFHAGAANQALPDISAMVCLAKVDMAQFYQSCPIDAEGFACFSHLFAHAWMDNDLKNYPHSLPLVQRYLAYAAQLASSFIDLAALVVIDQSMHPYWEANPNDQPDQHGWTSSLEHKARSLCRQIWGQGRWRYVLQAELANPSHDSRLILAALNGLQLTPQFADFFALLELNPLDFHLGRFVLLEHPEHYVADVLPYLQSQLPEAVFEYQPEQDGDASAGMWYLPDIWLLWLLRAMRKAKLVDQSFFLRCLTCRLPEVRIEAIHCLRAIRPKWDPQVMPRLEQCEQHEPVKNIRKRLLRLMGRNLEAGEKEQRYVDVATLKVVPAARDVCLLKTRIAGTFHRDMQLVAELVESGDVLFLVREPDNQHDPRAILVTAEDGYVLGYVPRVDNAPLAAMMDAGECLYAILLSDSLDNVKPTIGIFLQKGLDGSGNIIPFPKA